MNNFCDIDSTLPILLLNTGKRVLQQLDDKLAPHELSSAKLWTLHAVASTTGTATVTALADAMHTTKSNLTTMVDRLIVDGLVTRTQHPDDRRAVVIALTPQGRDRYALGCAVVQEMDEMMRAQFPDDATAALIRCLHTLLRPR